MISPLYSYVNGSITFFIYHRKQILSTIWRKYNQAVNWVIDSALMKDGIAILFPVEEVAFVADKDF